MSNKLLTWLNGRLVGKVLVIHKGETYAIWTLKEAREEGLTIEGAIARFVERFHIDLDEEVGHEDQL